jgi:hypothetical protein
VHEYCCLCSAAVVLIVHTVTHLGRSIYRIGDTSVLVTTTVSVLPLYRVVAHATLITASLFSEAVKKHTTLSCCLLLLLLLLVAETLLHWEHTFREGLTQYITSLYNLQNLILLHDPTRARYAQFCTQSLTHAHSAACCRCKTAAVGTASNCRQLLLQPLQ